MVKKTTILDEAYLLDESDKKMMKLIIKEKIFFKLMESYTAKEYEIVEYLVKELANMISSSKVVDLKNTVNNLVQKIDNNDYVIDTELDKIREIINIYKISNNL